jgi:hypothetical protein
VEKRRVGQAALQRGVVAVERRSSCTVQGVRGVAVCVVLQRVVLRRAWHRRR